MNIKKIVSAASALTIAASAFAGLATTASAEGTTTVTPTLTYVNYDDADTAYGYVTTATSGYNKFSSGTVGMANTGWGVDYVTFLKVDASAVTDTITSAMLKLSVSGSTDSKRECTYGAYYTAYTDWDKGLTYNSANTNGMLKGTGVGSTVKTSSKSATTFEDISIDITDAFKDDSDNVVTIGIYETAAAGGYITSPSVTIQSSSNSKDYTINYNYNGSAIRVDSGSSAVGATIDIDSYFTVDSQKYYAVDGSPTSLTISETDSENTVDVTLRLADTYTVTVNATGDITKKISADTTVVEGETVYFNYPRYIEDSGKLYEVPVSASSDGKGYQGAVKDANSTNTTVDLTYTQVYADDEIAFFKEAEDIEGLTVTADTARLSNGKGAYATEATTIATLPAGKYTIVTDARNHSNSNTATYSITAGGNSILDATINAYIQQQSADFTLNEETDLVLSELTTTETNLGRFGIDYILIVKTGDVETTTDTHSEAFTFTKTASELGSTAKIGIVFLSSSTGDTKDYDAGALGTEFTGQGTANIAVVVTGIADGYSVQSITIE